MYTEEALAKRRQLANHPGVVRTIDKVRGCPTHVTLDVPTTHVPHASFSPCLRGLTTKPWHAARTTICIAAL